MSGNEHMGADSLHISAVLPDAIPAAFLAHTGRILQVTVPSQGVCNLVLKLEAERGPFILKVARSERRVRQLQAENAILTELAGSAVPVPRSLALAVEGETAFQLQAYIKGTPLKPVLQEAPDAAARAPVLKAMGRMLAAIHSPGAKAAVRSGRGETWDQWLDRCLEAARGHMAAGLVDLEEEFSPHTPPAAVLQWLESTRPQPGAVRLLHGDYRPKNLLWRDGRIAGVIDWAFVDQGDPYYDLAIALWYAQGEDDRHWFLSGYGLEGLNTARLHYFEQLSKFLNV